MRFLVITLLIALFSCYQKVPHTSEYDTEIDSLISIMTLEEKAGQLTAYTSGWTVTGPKLNDNYEAELKAGRVGNIFNAHTVSYSIKLQKIAVEETRLGIPLLFGLDVVHGYKTTYPIPLAEACTWDTDIIERSARLSAKEASSAGINWTFSPVVDLARDPRWGRVSEASGEDTYLNGLFGAARVRGYQGDDLSDPTTVMACVKHYAGYGASKAGRDYHTVDMSDRMLRESYLPPYREAVDAGAASVMTSFNEMHGVPVTGSKYLMKEILRDEWGFEGFVVTDYTSINEMVPHGIVANEKEAVELAFNAGVQMDLQGALYSKYIPELVREGKIAEETLDEYVRSVLKKKYELGLFDDPYRYHDSVREANTLFSKEFFDHALLSARESIVLLKNENQLLPLSKEISSLALIGPLAENKKDLLGTWHVAGIAEKVVTLKAGIENVVPSVKINYAKGADFTGNDKSGFGEALSQARKSDVVVMAIGENYQQSGEAASRTEIGLPGPQQELLEEVYQLGKPIVVVLMAGRPLTIEWMDKNIPAILNTWHLGTQAGQAIAETLFGENVPSGKLTMTFPRSVGQIPIHYDMKNTGRPFDPNNKYTSKYIDSPNEPLYPFGYGLSYTSFDYSDISLTKESMNTSEDITVSVRVKNTGKFVGDEIIQLYIRDLVGSVTRPVLQLKGFKKITLKPGESREVSFTIDQEMLEFYTFNKKWASEPGQFKVFVGPNSSELKEASFELL